MFKESKLILFVVAIFSFLLLFGNFDSFKDYSNFFLYGRNGKENNNYKNYACHNYAHNLLLSVETNSIFMTEGGDNQVFSLLYFSYVENKRPDIDFFDQKGNIFPRLYGDLLNTYSMEIELIQDIRDYQLYSTGRPVYLTWKRNDITKMSLAYLQAKKRRILNSIPPEHGYYRTIIENRFRLDTLLDLKTTSITMIDPLIFDGIFRNGEKISQTHFKELGPWYPKKYGLVYKIIPIRYSILDALDFYNGTNTIGEIKSHIKRYVGEDFSIYQLEFFMEQLMEEGYIKQEEEKIILVKKLSEPLDKINNAGKYNENYYAYQVDNPHAEHWDFLTREIYGVYARSLFKDYDYQIAKNVTLFQKTDKESYLRIVGSYNSKKLKVVNEHLKYNYDNTFTYYLVGNEFLRQKQYRRYFQALIDLTTLEYKNIEYVDRAILAGITIYQENAKEDEKEYYHKTLIDLINQSYGKFNYYAKLKFASSVQRRNYLKQRFAMLDENLKRIQQLKNANSDTNSDTKLNIEQNLKQEQETQQENQIDKK